MSNPNDLKVYSPSGEMFEMSRANAHDLTTHAGWSFKAPTEIKAPAEIAACTVPPVVKETADAPSTADSARSVEASDTPVVEAEAETSTEAVEEAAEENDAVTDADFAHLEDRDAVVAYLAEHFPEFKPHHKSSRDGLVAKLVELTNG